jgi:hypothetical protein
MTKKALKLALEALDVAQSLLEKSRHHGKILAAYDTIKEALAQLAQEPVAWCVIGDGKFGEYKMGQTFVDYEATHTYWENRGYELVPVYTNIPI